jgi:hypothetical protein
MVENSIIVENLTYHYGSLVARLQIQRNVTKRQIVA